MIVALVLRGCYVGFARGGMTEVVHLVGVVAITAAAANGYGMVSRLLAPVWPYDPSALQFICFVLLFLIGMLVVYRIFYRLAANILRERGPVLLTQIVGVTAGSLRGLWWAGLAMLMLLALSAPYLQESVEQRSLLGAPTLRLVAGPMHRIVGWLPGGIPQHALIPSITLPKPRWPGDKPQGSSRQNALW